MISLSEYQRFQTKIESLRKRADESAGALRQIEADLKKEFKVGSLEEGQKLLQQLERDGEKAEREYAKASEEWERKWASRIESMSV